MSHPFGDQLSQHLHRGGRHQQIPIPLAISKHGLSQSKLAAGIVQVPSIITGMCKGQRLSGPQAWQRVIAVICWLREQSVLDTVEEANPLLNAAGMAVLHERECAEALLLKQLPTALFAQAMP